MFLIVGVQPETGVVDLVNMKAFLTVKLQDMIVMWSAITTILAYFISFQQLELQNWLKDQIFEF